MAFGHHQHTPPPAPGKDPADPVGRVGKGAVRVPVKGTDWLAQEGWEAERVRASGRGVFKGKNTL